MSGRLETRTHGFEPVHSAASPVHRFAVLTAGATLFLLMAGALVTSNDAGLAVPDWPLSYGSLMPPMVGGIFYEHGHRLVATFVGLLTIALAVWLASSETRCWVRRLGWTALGLVIAQGVLGGLTVKFLLPVPVSVAHATTAQLFFALVVSLAVFTSAWWQRPQGIVADAGAPPLRWLTACAVGAIVVQLILGALFRHKAVSIWPHVLWAMVLAALLVWTIRRVLRQHGDIAALRRWATLLGALVGIQVLLGLVAWWVVEATREFPQPLPAMVWTTVAHVVIGAATLGAAVVLMLCAWRATSPAADLARERVR